MGVGRASSLAAVLLLSVACTSTETSAAPRPKPVIPRADFRLPDTVGATALPSTFIGVVYTTDQILGLPGPGQPLVTIGDHGQLDDRFNHDLYDYVDAARADALADIPVVWFVDARVPLEAVLLGMATIVRSDVRRYWLATGSLEQPTMLELDLPPFTGPGRNDVPKRWVADLELVILPTGVVPRAHPREAGDSVEHPALDGLTTPEPIGLSLADGSDCPWASVSATTSLARTLCEADGEPYRLDLTIDRTMSYTALVEAIAADPRPTRCVAGPPRVSYWWKDEQPSCRPAITPAQIQSHFATQARELIESLPERFDQLTVGALPEDFGK